MPLWERYPHMLSGAAWLYFADKQGRRLVNSPLDLDPFSGTPGLASPAQSWGFNIPVGFEGLLFPHNEPAIAANALDPDNLVSIYHDYEAAAFTNGQRVVTKFSLDGGQTWSTRFEHPLLVAFGDSFDPAIAADGSGNFYVSYLTFDFDLGTTHLIVGRSADGGATWEHTIARAGEPFLEFLDKDYLAADPVTGALYATYTNFFDIFASIEVVRSLDGGISWEPPIVLETVDLFEVPGIHLLQGAYPAARDGLVTVAFYDSLLDGWLIGDFGLKVAVSNDGGATYSPPTLAAVLPGEMPFSLPSRAISFFHPRIWATMMPIPAIGPEGNIYLVATARSDNLGDIFFLRSEDEGTTWSIPLLVNDDATGRAQFFPWIAVQDEGTVHITFGDRRDDFDDTFYDVFYASSTDGGLTFSPNQPITDTTNTPSWFFIGDYFGLAASANAVHAIWTDNRVMEDLGDTFTVRGDKVVGAPAIRSIPSRAEVDEVVTLLGSGFAPSSTVTVFFEADIVATATTDGLGAFETTFLVPERIADRYFLSATDDLGNTALRFFLVKPTLVADPPVVEIGGFLTVIGSRYKPDTPVQLFLDEIFVGDAFSDATGSFVAGIPIASGPGGERTLSAIPLSPFWVFDDFDFATVTVLLPPGWSSKASLPEPREGAAGAVSGDEIFVMHGFTPFFGDTTDLRIYDIGTDTWFAGPPGLDPFSSEHYQGVTVVRDGLERLYMIGGRGFGVLSENREFTPATGTWEYRAFMPTPRAGAGVAVVDNRIYVMGGRDCEVPFCGTPLDAVEIYDPAADTWTSGSPMPTPRSGVSAAVLGGLVVVTGGWTLGDFFELITTDIVEIYDPLTDTWSTGPPMPTPRAYLGSSPCNGWVAVVGGIEADLFSFSSAFEIFHPAIGWQTGTILPTARGELVVVTHEDPVTGAETLYAIGGGLFGFSFDTVEAFDCSFLPPAPILLRVELVPDTGPVESTFEIVGSGAASEDLTIQAFWDEVNPDNLLGEALTDAAGEFTLTAVVPPALFGPHRVLVQDVGNTHFGGAVFNVIPSVKVTPERASPGQLIEVLGRGYLANVPLLVSFNDVVLTSVITDATGSWLAIVHVPAVQGGLHLIKGLAPLSGIGAVGTLTVVERATLDISIDTAPSRVRGEIVRLFALVSLEGEPVTADTVLATLYLPDGTTQTLEPVLIDQGVYAIDFVVLDKQKGDDDDDDDDDEREREGAPTGDYALVFTADLERPFLEASGADLVSFEVLKKLKGRDPGRVVSVRGDVAQVQTEERSLLLDLNAVNARAVAVEGTTVILLTDVGLLWVDLNSLNPRLVGYDGMAFVFETDLGPVRLSLLNVALHSPLGQAVLLGGLAVGVSIALAVILQARRKRLRGRR